ncbi:hypothetical protein GCM10027413_06380 [Conyzicola nivalis]|uniref:Uncharacterized protein n=1 Tax=Conyzicola nivalis TaxID=1477021 RepID=A0A916SKL2_9MICO|nr:hypothetical protein GCM10010979_20250 [Conyzicola nivalis]
MQLAVLFQFPRQRDVHDLGRGVPVEVGDFGKAHLQHSAELVHTRLAAPGRVDTAERVEEILAAKTLTPEPGAEALRGRERFAVEGSR